MTQRQHSDQRLPRDTSAQLRHDSGRTGDKVAASDPAAAPLGTDAEAGGAPPSPAEVAAAGAAERRPAGRRTATSARAGALTRMLGKVRRWLRPAVDRR